MAEQIRVERTIRAEAAELYDLVSDLPRMGEWSPENTGGAWVNGAEGPVVGARFKGSNKAGRFRWKTDVVVTVANPGEQFAFDVTSGPFKIANWEYRFEQDGAMTSVVETWTDHRIPVIGMILSMFVGVRDRPGRNRKNMEATLATLASAVEV
jgi:ribosome-associated toxin RatA of RatAB toxin-antitoxin module